MLRFPPSHTASRYRDSVFVKRRAFVAVPLAVLLAFGSTAALSGCSVRSVVRSVTHGHVDVRGHAVPRDFPQDVPLAHGEVVYGASVGSSESKVWNVTIKVHGTDAMESIGDQFMQAGFEEKLDNSSTKTATASFTKKPYSALVVVAKDAARGWVANYTVSEKG